MRNSLSLGDMMVNLSLIDFNLLLPVVTLSTLGAMGFARLVFNLAGFASLAFCSQIVQLRVIWSEASVCRC